MIAIPEPPILSARNGLKLLQQETIRAILEALATRPSTVGDLCAQMMLESDTTLREQLEQLERFGAIEKRVEGRGTADEFHLTTAGKDLGGAVALAGSWLSVRPGRGLSPQTEVAWRAVAALGDAWELSVIQCLLLHPSTKAELTETIPGLGREKTKRMLRRLRGAGLLRIRDGSSPPRYALTIWARRAIAVLATIAAWERRHLGGTAEPVIAFDGAVALLASLPLVSAGYPATGICAFTVEAGPDAPDPHAAAVWARLARGRVTACRPGASPTPPDAWADGRVDAWLDAVINARPRALHLGGDRKLAEATVRALHEVLFGGAPLLR